MNLWGNYKEVKLNETLNISKKNILLISTIKSKEQSKKSPETTITGNPNKKLEEKLAN